MQYGATVTGVGACVPEQSLTNADLERMVETSDEWILTRTGIRERRIAAESEGTADLAERAARDALNRAGVAPGEVGLIIVATCTPDLAFPPVASLVQARLKAGRAAAFDLNGVCAGFLSAAVTGAQFVRSGAYRHALVIGAETLSRITNYTDRNTCVLFGDGAGAIVLSRTHPDWGMLDFTLSTDGQQAGLLYCPLPGSPPAVLESIGAGADPYIWQNGKAIFRLAVNGMGDAVELLLHRQGLAPDHLRVLVPHQANQRIMTVLADRLKLPADRVANCIEEYGNTSAATIPLALHKWVQTEGLNPGDMVMLTAFGGGVLWGAALLRWGGELL
jgi:3-oxoacyl-[acyl-carrier-protein] synthase III